MGWRDVSALLPPVKTYRDGLHHNRDVVSLIPYDPHLPPLLLLVLWLSEAGGGAWCAIVTSKITHLPQKAASHPGGFFYGLRGIKQEFLP